MDRKISAQLSKARGQVLLEGLVVVAMIGLILFAEAVYFSKTVPGRQQKMFFHGGGNTK